MKINTIETFRAAVPLKKPFKTALRTVETAETIVVKVTCDNGIAGWGEAPPTVVITGDSLSSIESAIHHVLKPMLVNKSLLNYEDIFQGIQSALIGNSSAKAAVDMALYDCLAQQCKLPLYQFLGGHKNEVETDYTVSVNGPEEMGEDAVSYVQQGFNVLKVKVGKDDILTDIERIREIRTRVGSKIKIRLDANQGWKSKDAIHAIRKMEALDLNIELVEQPVKAWDIEGLKQVTDAVDTPIMADESVFSPKQAFEVIKTRSADLINIKLMKSGGIYQAQIINQLAEVCGMECMVGSMIETKIGITAAAHFAASKKNITRFDFDAPLMMAKEIVEGGIHYSGRKITLPSEHGLGIRNVSLIVNKQELTS
ncbi:MULTISPECIES: dipeptide epimerase [Cytobacillus]|uniref:Dipeptide epimerase n=2 Tax=Cytobacillus TaxID=2675230 RepID=A0A160M612_9BACI|nr:MULTISPECIES: dipeptide epimerase [Cytobacillus]MCS0826911.1 dipeptide epimerase [Cytobacillus firmus]AND37839.1 dipeptide epimerase [Cytobacillus oceanisediminis 2691]MCM3245963.1 dipeptide epimerase [Cytobacillus oceanisediminis]MCM3405081.1 dipeptide epimerase [Cytobacillus oceanisediminis]MDK7668574.1 dipeptide epimerase [Cytobacillus oceanisediminis]